MRGPAADPPRSPTSSHPVALSLARLGHMSRCSLPMLIELHRDGADGRHDEAKALLGVSPFSHSCRPVLEHLGDMACLWQKRFVHM